MILTIIICIIVSYIVCFSKMRERIPALVLAIPFGLLFGFVVAMIIGLECPCETIHCRQSELKAIEDDFGVEGRFFLGCGTIGTEQYYVFYRKRQEDGGFEYDKRRVEDVIIYEEEGSEKAVIKECSGGDIAGYAKYFGIGCRMEREDSKTRISVPMGTIKNVYNLDLQ